MLEDMIAVEMQAAYMKKLEKLLSSDTSIPLEKWHYYMVLLRMRRDYDRSKRKINIERSKLSS